MTLAIDTVDGCGLSNEVCHELLANIQHKENQLVSIQNLRYFLTLQKTLIIHYTIFLLAHLPLWLTQICHDSFVLASILQKTDAQHSFSIVFHWNNTLSGH